MPALEPSAALVACETALRELMAYCFAQAYGADWLDRVSSEKQRVAWRERAAEEGRTRRGTTAVPSAGLSYSNFYDLLAIADKHWEPLAAALGRKKDAYPLLERFEKLRNTVGHSRPLRLFEQELLSGIAGQVRNQVTLFMSEQDPAGDIYPRMESIEDSFGRRLESITVDSALAAIVARPVIIVHPGDVVTFTGNGVDPQDRCLRWQISARLGRRRIVVAPSGHAAELSWAFDDVDVSESCYVEVWMGADEARYHRFGSYDHRVSFRFTVRPPL